MLAIRLLALVVSPAVLTLASFASDPPKNEMPPPVPPPRYVLTDRIAVIGASLSAGFRLDGNLDAFAQSKLQLADVISASLNATHEPIASEASLGFFMDPKGMGAGTLATALEEKPSLLVALDYLFWFGYGVKTKEEERLADVELALQGLAKVECPILLGDLPDMSEASRVPDPVFGTPMLQKAMLPKPATLVKLNERIRSFAKEHKHVVLVPLAELTKKLNSDQEFEVRGNKYPKGSLDVLMQKDRLHPTLEGTCAVWVAAVDTWLATTQEVPASAFELDVKKILARLDARAKAATPAGAPPKKGEKPVEEPTPRK